LKINGKTVFSTLEAKSIAREAQAPGATHIKYRVGNGSEKRIPLYVVSTNIPVSISVLTF
jgi:hypothetical protein